MEMVTYPNDLDMQEPACPEVTAFKVVNYSFINDIAIFHGGLGNIAVLVNLRAGDNGLSNNPLSCCVTLTCNRLAIDGSMRLVSQTND
jgi:hypothetical protein